MSVKNRMHLDVVGHKAELRSLGATMVRARYEEIDGDVLADPEGDEFCVFATRGAAGPRSTPSGDPGT